MAKVNKWWSSDRKGVIHIVGDTSWYTKPNAIRKYFGGVVEPQSDSLNVYRVIENENGTFYYIGVQSGHKRYVKQSNAVNYFEPEQVGTDGNAQGLLSFNNLILIGGAYVIFKILGGTVKKIKKVV